MSFQIVTGPHYHMVRDPRIPPFSVEQTNDLGDQISQFLYLVARRHVPQLADLYINLGQNIPGLDALLMLHSQYSRSITVSFKGDPVASCSWNSTLTDCGKGLELVHHAVDPMIR